MLRITVALTIKNYYFIIIIDYDVIEQQSYS